MPRKYNLFLDYLPVNFCIFEYLAKTLQYDHLHKDKHLFENLQNENKINSLIFVCLTQDQ